MPQDHRDKEVKKKYSIQPGHRFPFGATFDSKGTNFSVWGRFATRVELLLYEGSDSPTPFQVIELDSEVNKTFYAWHVYVEGLAAGTFYGWRMDGPEDTQSTGFRFDKGKVLLDPWAQAVTHELWDRRQACLQGDNNAFSMRSIVLGNDQYDWEGDEPLNHPMEQAIIYEMHVGGFTRHPCLMHKHFLTGKRKEGMPFPDVTWHGIKLQEPLWHDRDAQILAYTLGRQREGEEDLHIVLNMSDQGMAMPLPSLSGRVWHRAVDTGQLSPGDILEPEDQPRLKDSTYPVYSHSIVVFGSR